MKFLKKIFIKLLNIGPKDVEANRPIGVDVGVVDPGCEGYLLIARCYTICHAIT